MNKMLPYFKFKIVSLFFCELFLVSASYSQSALPVESFGVWDRGNVVKNFSDPNVDFIKGIETQEKWSDCEAVRGVFNFSQSQAAIDKAYANKVFVRFSINVGPDAPLWMYDNDTDSTNNPYPQVQKITTSGGNDKSGWPFYPQYLTTAYKTYYYRLIQKFAEFLRSQPEEKFKYCAFVQVKTGCTGDECAFKGNVDVPANDITDPIWQKFRVEAFDQFKKFFNDVPTHRMPLTFNNVDAGKEDLANKWLMSQVDRSIGFGLKGGAYNRGIHLNDEKNFASTWVPYLVNPKGLELFSASEMDGTWENANFQENCDISFYWCALGGINTGLSCNDLNGTSLTYVLAHPSCVESFRMFTRYAQQVYPAKATVGFCVFHEGLNAANTVKFPVKDYGNQPATRANIQRYLAIANSPKYKNRGALVRDSTSHISDGQVGQRGNLIAYNDVGWDINEGNIERFFTQINPDSTSIGLFRVRGPITKTSMKYDRFARSFEHSTGKDTMYFKFDSEMFIDSKPKNLNFKIIWLDKNAGSTWTFCYKSPEGIKNALQLVKGIGDNQWKTVTFTISNAVLDKSGRFGSDCMLVNTDNTDDIFNSIEVGIERELSTGVVTNTMTKDLHVQVFPIPASSVIDIQTCRPINYVELYSLSGKVVLRKNAPHNSLDISSLSRGIYLLKTVLDNGLTINKIIKE
jgi:hypothetical protein